MYPKLSKSLFVILLLVMFCLSVGMVCATDIHGPVSDSKSIDDIHSDLTVDDSPSISVTPMVDDSTVDSSSHSFTNSDVPSNLNVNLNDSVLNPNGNSTKSNYSCNVSCEKDFKDLSKYLDSCNKTYDHVFVDIVKDIKVSGSNILSVNNKDFVFVIRGNDKNITVSSPNDHGENHFLECGKNGKVFINNLTLSGFNTAINNYGNVALQNVKFLSNRMDYWKFGDYGGAIWNRANLCCVNCSFINNRGSYGGAIFSNGTDSKLGLINCYFKDNEGYRGDWSFWNFRNKIGNSICENNQIFEGPGHDVMVGGNGIVYSYYMDPYKDKLHGPGAFIPTPNSEIKFSHDRSDYRIIFRNSMEPVVREFNITDSRASLANAINSIRDAGNDVDAFIINLNADVTVLKQYLTNEHMLGLSPHYGNVIFNGNDHKFNLVGATNLDECHFATINRFSSLFVNNLTIDGFNCAVMNNGSVFFNNVTFSGNHVKYITDSGDDAGAISNFRLLVCNDCTFVNNFGLWAGAIYGAHGAHNYLNNCTFIDNKHSKSDGADLYSYDDAKFFIDGLEVNGTGLNSIGINNHHINGTNITINYGYPPSGAKKVTLQLLGFGTQLLSFGIGFGFGLAGCPVAGIFVGGIVGSALKISGDAYYASLTHTSYNLWKVPEDIVSHFLIAMAGSKVGTDLRQYIKTRNAPQVNTDNHVNDINQERARSNNQNIINRDEDINANSNHINEDINTNSNGNHINEDVDLDKTLNINEELKKKGFTSTKSNTNINKYGTKEEIQKRLLEMERNKIMNSRIPDIENNQPMPNLKEGDVVNIKNSFPNAKSFWVVEGEEHVVTVRTTAGNRIIETIDNAEAIREFVFAFETNPHLYSTIHVDGKIVYNAMEDFVRELSGL